MRNKSSRISIITCTYYCTPGADIRTKHCQIFNKNFLLIPGRFCSNAINLRPVLTLVTEYRIGQYSIWLCFIFYFCFDFDSLFKFFLCFQVCILLTTLIWSWGSPFDWADWPAHTSVIRGFFTVWSSLILCVLFSQILLYVINRGFLSHSRSQRIKLFKSKRAKNRDPDPQDLMLIRQEPVTLPPWPYAVLWIRIPRRDPYPSLFSTDPSINKQKK